MKTISWIWPMLFSVTACAQSVTTVEVYGAVPAVQVYAGLGSNLTQTNAWEYAALQAIHGTWARSDCGWTGVELTKGSYTFPSSCASAMTNSSTYNIHPVLDALYGPPYTAIATGTLNGAVSSGATTMTLTVSTGSLSGVVAGQTEVLMNPQWSSKASYSGALITGISGTTLTMASAATSSFASGTAVTVNLLFYPPVLIPVGQGYKAYQSNASLQAYANYAHYLATQVAAAGLTGEVSLWNEPPWSGDPWDMAPNLYDTPPANGAVAPGTPGLGIENAFYNANLGTLVTGVPYDSGYTETSGFVGSLFFPNWVPYMQSISQYKAMIGTESFHPYGNNPEDSTWLGNSCIYANLGNFTNIINNCTPTGGNSGSAYKLVIASSFQPKTFGGVGHSITETGLCTGCTGATNTQVTRFDLRQFIPFQALGITPVIFYRMYGDSNFQWCTSSTGPTCNPVYYAFQNLMTDIGSIASSPVAPYSACMMPRVSSFTGYYPLATASFVGLQSGDKSNSILYYTWQRTYGSTWTSVASPTAVNVSVVVPTGLTVSSVKDTVTAAAVSFTFSSQTLTYAVADDPVEVLLSPISATTSPSLVCT